MLEETIYYAIAGATSGISSSLYTCPLDVVKTKIQSQIHPSSLATLQYANHVSTLLERGFLSRNYSIPLYRGTISTLRRIWIEEGLKGWYRGLGPTLLGYLPTWSIYFTSYNHFKIIFSSYLSSPYLPLDSSSPIIHIFSAVAAGSMSAIATNPLWVIRTRLMVQSKNHTPFYYSNAFEAFVSIFRTEGLKGLYKGLTPSLLGTTHVAIQFPLYEFLKRYLSRHDGMDTRAVLISSVISKTMASIISYPHELIRTRLQNQSEPSNQSTARYRGLLHAIVRIYKEESISGFYRGLPTNLAKVVPASAVTFFTFEVMITYFQSKGLIHSADNDAGPLK